MLFLKTQLLLSSVALPQRRQAPMWDMHQLSQFCLHQQLSGIPFLLKVLPSLLTLPSIRAVLKHVE